MDLIVGSQSNYYQLQIKLEFSLLFAVQSYHLKSGILHPVRVFVYGCSRDAEAKAGLPMHRYLKYLDSGVFLKDIYRFSLSLVSPLEMKHEHSKINNLCIKNHDISHTEKRVIVGNYSKFKLKIHAKSIHGEWSA